ncbi:PAS domain-containing protein [Streptomyces sp. NBC_01387]|uniref:PAS domain-containing protein n=1 Tax=unclassified Streptomyces TaxID=2593676 RepID=UPI0022589A8F|nr:MULTISPECIES: PAS domain-containing protein [unclassified Streptomyces]MCX4547552.1 PAS domain-containing protein [Streptomyces sp. NBC_01500]WSV53263.1 PAS domain-containing protein [Streptomyces sp. NBC_01014]
MALIPRQSTNSIDTSRPADSSLFDAEIRSDEYGDVVLSFFERSGIGLAILDPTLRVRAVNGAFSGQCGRHHDDICERSFAEFLHPSVRQYLMRQFGRLVQGHHARLVGQSIAMWFNDTALAGKLSAFPVDDDAGKVKMIMVQFTPEKSDDQQVLIGAQRKLTPLTARVLEGVAAGDPTVRLAAKLFLSRQGIEYHVSILLRQFKVPNRTALAAKAYSMGMFSIGCWPPTVLPEYIRADRNGSERTRGDGRQDAHEERRRRTVGGRAS